MSKESEFFIVPDLTYGSVYYVFTQLAGGDYKEHRIELVGNVVFNINSLEDHVQEYVRKKIATWHERKSKLNYY